jgi:hypothetical protein
MAKIADDSLVLYIMLEVEQTSDGDCQMYLSGRYLT